MSSNGEVKIADFGVSKQLTNGTMAMTFTGTQAYLAPERVREGSNCSPVADVWGVGLTLVEIATGKFPFPPEAMNSIMDLLEFINSDEIPTLPPNQFSEEFCKFISCSLKKDPASRATPEQLMQSPFILSAIANPPDIVSWCRQIASRPHE
jgi:serine/threonine protein kinase